MIGGGTGRATAPERRPRQATRPARGRGMASDRGASSLEFAAMLPLTLFVGMALIQLGVAGYAVQQAGTAARAAARTAAQEDTADQYAAIGAASISDWLSGSASFDSSYAGEEVTVTATLTIPSVVPGVGSLGSASRSVTMPRD